MLFIQIFYIVMLFFQFLSLLNDLILWQSLLPSEPHTRAVLQIGGGVSPSFSTSDHRFWFFAEPVAPGSIYAHPSAALDAEERHRMHLQEGTSWLIFNATRVE